jgi:hypothetical protein
MNKSLLLQAGLRNYDLGWSNFPVGDDKKPFDGWKERQTIPLDKQALELAFRDPRAVGIAVACGALSNITAIDIEGPHLEHEAVKDLFTLAPVGTPRARSGGGGVHLYFAHSGERNASLVSPDGEHLGDVRGEGGYLICPPSRHPSGNTYTWKVEPSGPLSKMPEEFVAVLARLRKPDRKTSAPRPVQALQTSSMTFSSRYVQAAFEAEVQAVQNAQAGTRNDTLNSAAFALGQFIGAGQLERGFAEDALRIAARNAGLGDAEIEATISSGLDAGIETPRILLETGGSWQRKDSWQLLSDFMQDWTASNLDSSWTIKNDSWQPSRGRFERRW